MSIMAMAISFQPTFAGFVIASACDASRRAGGPGSGPASASRERSPMIRSSDVLVAHRFDVARLRLARGPGVHDGRQPRAGEVRIGAGVRLLPDRPKAVDVRVMHPEDRISRCRG